MKRNESRLRTAVAVAAVSAVTVAGVWLVGSGSAGAATDGGSYAPSTTWEWTDGPSLGTTTGADQWASASVSGLTDSDHNAGFELRNNGDGHIRVAMSGTQWKIEPSAGPVLSGDFAAPSTGTLRVAVTAGNAVTITFNGTTVTTQTVTGSYPGRGIAPTVWQASATVRLTGIQSNVGDSDVDPPSPSGSPGPSNSPTSPPPAGGKAWMSGAASEYAADGAFGAWRGEPVTIAGTWDNGIDGQTELYSISIGDFKDWTGPIDEAIGAIYKPLGESWSQAASGAYDGRWTTSLTNLKAKWGSRNPANLYVRFGHEMNGSWVDWNVRPGEEADFRAALTRFSNLRYRIIPQIHLVLCPAADGSDTGIDVRDLFVARDDQGRRVVDVYAADSYNQYPHRTDYNQIMASFSNTASDGAPLGIEAQRRFAEASGVPFAVSEWGNCGLASECEGGGGEASAYVRAFNDWARAHAGPVTDPKAGQLLYEVYFNLWNRFLLYPSSPQPQTAAAYAALVWGR